MGFITSTQFGLEHWDKTFNLAKVGHQVHMLYEAVQYIQQVNADINYKTNISEVLTLLEVTTWHLQSNIYLFNKTETKTPSVFWNCDWFSYSVTESRLVFLNCISVLNSLATRAKGIDDSAAVCIDLLSKKLLHCLWSCTNVYRFFFFLLFSIVLHLFFFFAGFKKNRKNSCVESYVH